MTPSKASKAPGSGGQNLVILKPRKSENLNQIEHDHNCCKMSEEGSASVGSRRDQSTQTESSTSTGTYSEKVLKEASLLMFSSLKTYNLLRTFGERYPSPRTIRRHIQSFKGYNGINAEMVYLLVCPPVVVRPKGGRFQLSTNSQAESRLHWKFFLTGLWWPGGLEQWLQRWRHQWYLDSVLSWIFIQLTSLEVSRIMGEVALSSCKSCQQDRGGESSARVHTSLVRHQQLGGSSYIAGLPAFAVMGQ